jgi:aspartate/methionine/tyrosine aminotransferase
MLNDFSLEVFFSRWEFTARHMLCGSDLETLSVDELLALGGEDAREAWRSLRLGYIPTTGTPELRAAVAATYEHIVPDDLLCFAGAEEGIYCVMHALLGRDDHAVVLVPNYQSVEEVPLSLCAVTGVALREEDNWELDVDAVRAALTPATRLLAINFPNNPTGASIAEPVLHELIALAAERGIYLLSDEVYRGIEHEPAMRLPQVADLYDRGLSLGVMSKAYGLAGLRVGWIASRDRELLARMERVKHYLSICNSAPSELLATIALGVRHEILARNRALVQRNLTLLDDFFARHSERFEWRVPDGGCIAFPRYLGAEGVEEFCRTLVTSTGVLLLPGSVYRSRLLPVDYARFRIGFGRRDMPQALALLDEYLARVPVAATP